MRIVHISDTHGAKFHKLLEIPECDVLIHSGDIGGRTNTEELGVFLNWFKAQPAKARIFCAGNHDIILDKIYLDKAASIGSFPQIVADNMYQDALNMIRDSGVIYLQDEEYIYEGVKFYGSPYTPSFHRAHWAFNADRGEEISKIWSKIPLDTTILITHGPPHGILDVIPENFKLSKDEDLHRGCEELRKIIEKMNSLEMCCFGHIHEGPTAQQLEVINNKPILFSNAAMLDNKYRIVYTKPSIIEI